MPNNKTILSGDLLLDDAHALMWDEATNHDSRKDNTFHVLSVNNATGVIIDGFIITHGNANGVAPCDSGGALYMDNASLVIRNCDFQRNTASGGGAVFCRNSYPLFYDCTFTGNSASKLYSTELAQKLANYSTEIMGLYGQLEDDPHAPLDGFMVDLYQMCKGATIFAGTNEIQRNLIAWVGLGLPRLKFK